MNGLLEDLKYLKLLSPTELESLEFKIRYENLKALANTKDLSNDNISTEYIEKYWQKLHKKYKTNTQFILLYCQLLLSKNEQDKAETVIRVALAKYWNEEFVSMYGKIHSSNPQNQITTAERWIKEHDQNPVLLLALAKLYLRVENEEKAQGFLNASLYLTPTFEGYIELANLYARQGNMQKSVEIFQQALQQNDASPPASLLHGAKEPVAKLSNQ